MLGLPMHMYLLLYKHSLPQFVPFRSNFFVSFLYSIFLQYFSNVATIYGPIKFQPFTKTVFNLFPKKQMFLSVCSTSLLKTQWKKEKLLVTSNIFFSHSVFYCFGELFHQIQNCRLQTLSV